MIGTGAGGGRVTAPALVPQNVRLGKTVTVQQGTRTQMEVAGTYDGPELCSFCSFTGNNSQWFIYGTTQMKSLEMTQSSSGLYLDKLYARMTSLLPVSITVKKAGTLKLWWGSHPKFSGSTAVTLGGTLGLTAAECRGQWGTRHAAAGAKLTLDAPMPSYAQGFILFYPD